MKQPRLKDLISQLPLKLKAARVVEGFIAGIHSSPFRGFSAEFEQHRSYQPGDDLRYFDWKVWARTEKRVIRQYSEETNLKCTFVVDCSASMNWPGDPASKWEYAKVLTASLIHLLIRQRDATGLILVSDTVQDFRQPKSFSWYENDLFTLLETTQPARETRFDAGLALAAQTQQSRGLVILVSDFLQPVGDLLPALRLLSSGRQDILAVQVLDPREQILPELQDVLLQDLESGIKMETHFQQVKPDYQRAFTAWQLELKALFADTGIQFLRVSTDEPVAVALMEILNQRRRK